MLDPEHVDTTIFLNVDSSLPSNTASHAARLRLQQYRCENLRISQLCNLLVEKKLTGSLQFPVAQHFLQADIVDPSFYNTDLTCCFSSRGFSNIYIYIYIYIYIVQRIHNVVSMDKC